jgi:hypothetical protein
MEPVWNAYWEQSIRGRGGYVAITVRGALLAAVVSVCLVAASGPALAGGGTRFEPGAAGAGDPYFPLDGNGGYDVLDYLLDLRYTPQTDVLAGTATITARATQHLSSFNLDLDGLTVRSVTVDGRPAAWSRNDGELTVVPRHGLREGSRYTTVVRYDGVPVVLPDESGFGGGFLHTDDGAVVIGQPHVAATWFPVNDHPSDKAAYTFRVTVPAGLEAVSNGVLESQRTHDGWTTWTWKAKEPMASYLATATIGEFDIRSRQVDGVRYWDAFDPDLFVPVASPRTGSQFAISQVGDPSYKRLARTISVPASGAQLSFWIQRDTEDGWDFTFVEAHTVGADNWTTLPDTNGHTSSATGNDCPLRLSMLPFLAHYMTPSGEFTCAPSGTSGTWNAATGTSDGYEQWTVDLSAYAGTDVEVSISYASDDAVQLKGAFVDDITVSTGAGTTSFETDGDTFDGWTVPGAPPGGEPNPNDWIAGTVADLPPTDGEIAKRSLDRQAEIVTFLSDTFGGYPFLACGGIVDDTFAFSFALENQTRPIYSRVFFEDQINGDSVVVHELTHQWFGDSLTVAGWQHIWLNEGFAQYAEWLWSEQQGLGTAQENFDAFYYGFPPDAPFWTVTIGDPGTAKLFNFAVYARGAMTLHQLRLTVGDNTFFHILRTWATTRAGATVTTPEFIALAEHLSGQQLDAPFTTWLFTPGRPDIPNATGARAGAVPPAAANHIKRAGG